MREYHQALYITPRVPPSSDTSITNDIHDLTWVPRSEYPEVAASYAPKYLVCMQAYAACGDEAKCRTPSFYGDEIPERIIDWMRNYADILCVGMVMGRERNPTR